MSFLNREGIKKGIAGAILGAGLYLGSLGYKTENNYKLYPQNNHVQYRTDAVNVWKDYKPTEKDLLLDFAIINRDTLDTNTDAWKTLINPSFSKWTDLLWDNGLYGFFRWINNGIQPQIEFVRAVPPIGLSIKAKERLADPVLSKYVTDFYAIVSPRDFGKLYSKAANVKYLVERFLESEEYEKFRDFMKSKGLKEEDIIREYATGFISKSAVAGVGPLSYEQAKLPGRRFYLNTDFARKLGREAEVYDINVLNALINTIEHELVHTLGIKDEKTLEELLVEFYESQIRQLPDSNTTYATRRHYVEKGKRLNYEQRRLISKVRSEIVKELYGTSKSIDELVAGLEKEGLSEKDIETAISLYEGKAVKLGKNSKGEKSDNYKATDEYDAETAYKAESRESTETSGEGAQEGAGDGGEGGASE